MINNIQTVVSSALFYILPILVGNILYPLFHKKLKTKKRWFFIPISLGQKFIYGSFLLFIEANIIKLLQNLFYFNFIKTYVLVLVIQSIVGLFLVIFKTKTKRVNKKTIKENLSLTLPFIFLLFISIIGYGIWKFNSPTNTTLNWDLYEHQTITNHILEGNFEFNPLNLSDTFNFFSYSTIFHLLLVNAQVLIKNVNIPLFWWFVQFLHYFVTIVVSFLLGYAVLKNKTVAIISGIIGAFIFESFIAYTSLFLIPQTLVGTLVALVLAEKLIEKKVDHKISFFITLLFFILTHGVIGVAGVFIIVFSLVFLHLYQNEKPLLKKALIIISLLLIPITFLTSNQLNLDSLNRGEAAHFNLSIQQKFNYMKRFYGYSFLILFNLGLIYTLVKKRVKSNVVLMVLLSLGSLSIVLSQLPYVLKFYTVSRYFIHVVMALGFWILIKNFSKKIQVLFITLLTLALILVYTLNIESFKQNIIQNGRASHISKNELQAANFLKEKYMGQKDILIVSEPATMYIMESLTGISSPGGVFTDVKTRSTLSKIYFSRDSQLMRNDLFKIVENKNYQGISKILLIISGRFSKWQLADEKNQKPGIVWNVWKPSDVTYDDLEFIEFIDKNTDFKKIYKNSGLIIYEID